MQKLVTVYLDSYSYAKKRNIKMDNGSLPEAHGLVEEHLEEYLRNDWVITAIHGLGSRGSTAYATTGWLAVVLEKNM